MAIADQYHPVGASALPDFALDPDAVLKDKIASWRYGRAPDYSNTRKVWSETKSKNHKPGTLPDLVENLVKNWEVEASFKKDINDWRTIDKDNYSFSVNGGPSQYAADYMLKVGTYNAVITPNEFFSPDHSDFNSSHKTFKRMMPTFAWEVIEVYSSPPQVSFRWRHWGVMKMDYMGFNQSGEKVTIKAHGGKIDFQGVTVVRLTNDFRIQTLETWFDPLEMFRQIQGDGVVNKEVVGRLGKYQLPPGEDHTTHLHGMDDAPKAKTTNGDSPFGGLAIRNHVDSDDTRPSSPAESTRTTQTITFEEMSKMTPADCPFLMKWRTFPLEGSVYGSEGGRSQPVDSINPWSLINTETTFETTVSETREAPE